MSTALWVIVAFVAIAVIVSGLLRMRTWLRDSPPLPEPLELPGDKDDD